MSKTMSAAALASKAAADAVEVAGDLVLVSEEEKQEEEDW